MIGAVAAVLGRTGHLFECLADPFADNCDEAACRQLRAALTRAMPGWEVTAKAAALDRARMRLKAEREAENDQDPT